MDLQVKDVAELLNVSESTIHRWLSEEKIPAYKLNQQYRFSRTEIEDWVFNHKRDHTEVLQGHSDHKENKEGSHLLGSKQFSLYRAIHRGNVLSNIPGETKEEVIRATMKAISPEIGLDADVLTDLLLDREHLQPTALNNGIGIPHTRDFLLGSHYDIVTLVFPKQPLVYGALDGLPVHTLFFLFACDDKRHLHLLAKIAHLSTQKESLDFLKSHPTKEAVLDHVKKWESLNYAG